MPSLRTILEICLLYSNLVVSGLLVYLSVRVVPPSLSRTYCLNLGIPMLFYNIYWVVLQQTAFHESKPSTFQTALITNLGLIREFTQYNYVYFSTLTVFLAYIAYSAPVLFKTLAMGSTMICMVCSGHLLASLSVFILSPGYGMHISLFGMVITKTMVFAIAVMVHLLTTLMFYIAMVVLYILAIIKMRRKIAVPGANSSNVSSHRRMLKSILVYCTPPNVFAVLAIPRCLFNTWRAMSIVWGVPDPVDSGHPLKDFLYSVLVLQMRTENIRMFVTVFTAFIAFHDYRMAIKKGFIRVRKLFSKVRSHSTVAQSTGNSLFNKTSTHANT
ncbi:hypothetical protein QR680_004021 [Steinernema hermaphroditum]|uniref:Uncharacterized protein n=1 Tax=Steinernema hermaphroditum TaxID=289476 RepID=A0AA39LSJ8_9BILA|nr:hypothetical protein QR680_004021 [Steinernema hermaphroditum]